MNNNKQKFRLTNKFKTYISEEIDKKIRGSFWKSTIRGIIFIALTALSTYLITIYTSERGVNLTVAHELIGNAAIIKLHDDSRFHSTSKITITGRADGEDKILTELENDTLHHDHDIAISVPTKTIQKCVSFVVKDEEFELDKFIIYNEDLEYRVECENCIKPIEKKIKGEKIKEGIWIMQIILDDRTVIHSMVFNKRVWSTDETPDYVQKREPCFPTYSNNTGSIVI